MYGYVYKPTDLRNNKIYVGQHKSKVFDTNYYGSGIIIKELLNKYGNQILKMVLILIKMVKLNLLIIKS